ncbi:hypothetical protein A3SI_13302 [Nitritalea halalkaliphila LW7]|uniref:Uncharacterized protein n=1 Tax=Nitritalea halalkaliphila LW7 TaxID=1189621 RepID=I5C0N6_9BACT|nr:hypothetical protein [Nitritalea halalkaliphila]EIM75388.1 hypothetical protein A3SI_13302 [Nitritalea halalkaliphila LW7]
MHSALRTLLLITCLSPLSAALAQQELQQENRQENRQEMLLEMRKLSSQLELLQRENETLHQNLDLTSKSLQELIRDKNISDETRYALLKSGIKQEVALFRKLSDQTIHLKSRLTDQEYQSFILSLGSMEASPLGFSFEEVLMTTIKQHGVFESKAKIDRFLAVSGSLIQSPITAALPFVSQAVAASNALLNVAYTSMMTEKKPDFSKLQQLETELMRYLHYFSALDRANASHAASQSNRIEQVEKIQAELSLRLTQDAQKLGLKLPERKDSESIDDYLNRCMTIFNPLQMETFFTQIENKYRGPAGTVNYALLLQREEGLKAFHAQAGNLVSLAKRFTVAYEAYMDANDRYHRELLEALALAHTNKIIQPRKVNGQEESPELRYTQIRQQLAQKKQLRDQGIRNSLNMPELAWHIERTEELRYY